MQILPAIDITNGATIYRELGSDPVIVAKHFEKLGFTYLHLVDMDAVLKNKTENVPFIQTIISQSKCKVEVNVGKKFIDTLQVAKPWQVILPYFSEEDTVLVKNIQNTFGHFACTISFSITDTVWDVQTALKAAEQFTEMGIRRFILRGSEVDGTMQGPLVKPALLFKEKFEEAEIIVSGGIGSIQDVQLLKSNKIDGVIIGKALYTGAISWNELAKLAS